ncbi:hypothetical protein RhiirB3_455611 [Rhizophagus irregularis]|nr:hypothetical protein RhiirB3_455611 [Rhizophagus irregularis]
MPGGPVKRLADFAKECKDKKSKAFSSYRSLKEVLKKFDIDGNGIGTIRQFPPVTYKLEDEEEELQQCIKEIKRKITDKELTLAPQLEVVGEESTGRVDYAIKALEELLCITEGKLHQVVMGFAQNLIQCESALQVNKNKRKRKSGEAFGMTTTISIGSLQQPRNGISSFLPRTEYYAQSALEEGSEEEKELHKNVKRVMEVIVGLLKDR